jgi:hypothetical protein
MAQLAPSIPTVGGPGLVCKSRTVIILKCCQVILELEPVTLLLPVI